MSREYQSITPNNFQNDMACRVLYEAGGPEAIRKFIDNAIEKTRREVVRVTARETLEKDREEQQ